MKFFLLIAFLAVEGVGVFAAPGILPDDIIGANIATQTVVGQGIIGTSVTADATIGGVGLGVSVGGELGQGIIRSDIEADVTTGTAGQDVIVDNNNNS